MHAPLRIARALAPRILVLHVAAALDCEAERQFQEAMETVAKNRTVIIIARKLRAIRGADPITLMDQGRVVEKGTHTALMAARGVNWGLNGDG